MEGFWAGPGIVSEVRGGLPDIDPGSRIAQGSLKERSGIDILPPRAPRRGIKGGITTLLG